jgi:hypothetical protein
MIEYIESIILSTKERIRFTIDDLKFKFKSLTGFFEYIDKPLVSSIKPLRENHTPSSIAYNKFLSYVENDVNLIHKIQDQIKDNMLMSWNVSETSYPGQIKEDDEYDDGFILEHDSATVLTDRLTSGVNNFIDAIPFIKDKPILKAESSDPNIPVYYGKMFGSYIYGNESGEDGIRFENNDGSLIVDGKDTFWECEAMVLQEYRDDTLFFQKVYDKDISLTTTIKIIFKEPVAINTLVIIPYSGAASAYYKLMKIELSDGIKVLSVDVKETFILGETNFIFNIPEEFTDKKVRSMFITLKQENGYYMKYMLGYFKIKNNESWLDITGPHVCEMARAYGDNFNNNVTHFINNINEWILNYWMPGTSFTELPELVNSVGDEGYALVPSSESKRKRYTIGISDIKVGFNEYSEVSEKVTDEIEIPEGYNSISLDVNDQGDNYYFLSFDNGMTWNRIIPVGKEPVRNSDLYLVPDKLYINSDISLKRKQNSVSGERAFISTTNKSLRVRFVLQRGANGLLPSVFNWKVNFGVN